MEQLQRMAGPSHRHANRGAPVPLRGDPRVQRLASGFRQRGGVPVSGAGLHRRAARLQLRAHARRRLQQPALHPHRVDRRPPDSRTAPLGRQHDDRGGGAPHGPGVSLRRLQETARGHLDGGGGAAARHPGLWAHRISVALGQSRLLGNRGHHPDRRAGSRGGAVPDAPSGRRRSGGRGDLRPLLRHARAAVAAGHHSADRAARLPRAQTRRRAGTGR